MDQTYSGSCYWQLPDWWKDTWIFNQDRLYLFLLTSLIMWYRCWKKSCTTRHVWNPVKNAMCTVSTGAGFLASTVFFALRMLQKVFLHLYHAIAKQQMRQTATAMLVHGIKWLDPLKVMPWISSPKNGARSKHNHPGDHPWFLQMAPFFRGFVSETVAFLGGTSRLVRKLQLMKCLEVLHLWTNQQRLQRHRRSFLIAPNPGLPKVAS